MSVYPAYLAFPFRIGSDGRSALVRDLAEHVRDELLQLVLTTIGERLFLPEFGTPLRRMVFEGADEGTKAVTKATVAQALSGWLGQRITVDELSVTAEAGAIEVLVRYRLAGTDESKLVRFVRSAL